MSCENNLTNHFYSFLGRFDFRSAKLRPFISGQASKSESESEIILSFGVPLYSSFCVCPFNPTFNKSTAFKIYESKHASSYCVRSACSLKSNKAKNVLLAVESATRTRAGRHVTEAEINKILCPAENLFMEIEKYYFPATLKY